MNEKKKILIIDDNADYRQAMYLCITKAATNVSIKMCCNGKEGLQTTNSWMPDIIFIDYLMPEMDGLTVMKQIKNNSKTQHILVIIMSANNIEAKGCSFVKKPIQPKYVEQLLKSINESRLI